MQAGLSQGDLGDSIATFPVYEDNLLLIPVKLQTVIQDIKDELNQPEVNVTAAGMPTSKAAEDEKASLR